MRTQYYRIIKRQREYRGIRFFKFTLSSQSVIQVCVSEGEIKKGKGHSMGIVLIHSMTFLSNYLAPGAVELCRRDEYERAFVKTVKLLK